MSSPRTPDGTADEPARQLDLFADSGEVIRRNIFADAVLDDDEPLARRALAAWLGEWPADSLLAPAATLLAHLRAAGSGPAATTAPALTAADVLSAIDLLETQVEPAAAALLGQSASAWLTRRWHGLAAQARGVAWHPEVASAHAAPLFLRARQWSAAAQAVASIASWRRIPQPLLWMAQARWHAEGADAAWPLLAEAFWLAPRPATVLLQGLADRRLRQAMERFDDEFQAQDDDDWAWWPAWLAVDQPLLAEVLGLAQAPPDRTAAAGFGLIASLLRLERSGRQHELLATRRRLQALEPRLFRCYMRTR